MYGARPLKRVIQRSLQNPLAGLILEGSVQEGETVHVSAGPRGLHQRGVGRGGVKTAGDAAGRAASHFVCAKATP